MQRFALVLVLALPAFGAESPGTHREQALVQTWSKQLDGAATGAGVHDTPVTRVTNLLKELMDQMKKDLEEDEKLTKELLCWCNDQRWTKGEEKADTDGKIKHLISEIERLVALIKELEALIADLKAKIKEVSTQLITVSEKRDEEHQIYIKTDASEIAQMENLRAAIIVLDKHAVGGTMPKVKTEKDAWSLLAVDHTAHRKDFPWGSDHQSQADLQMDQFLMDQGMALGEALQEAKPASGFLQHEATPMKPEQPSTPKKSPEAAILQLSIADQLAVEKGVQTARAIAKAKGLSTALYTPEYTAQSGEILGILKQMYDNIEVTEHPNTIATEKKALEIFVAVRKDLLDQREAMTWRLDAKEDELAQAKIDLANAKEELTRQGGILGGLAAYIAALEKMCAEAQKNFDLRKAARLEEMKAVSETIEILMEDDARDNAAGTYGEGWGKGEALIQVSAESTRIASLRKEAVARLFATGRLTGSPGLIALATSAELDSFAKVKKAIDDMIAMLTQQQEDDQKKNEWCTDEIQENDMTTAKTEDRKKDLEAKIEELGLRIEKLGKEIVAAHAEIESLQGGLQRANEDRQKANLEFQSTVAEQRATIEVLSKALDKLATYYDGKGDSYTIALQLWRKKSEPVLDNKPPAGSSSSSSSSSSIAVTVETGTSNGFAKVDHTAIAASGSYTMAPPPTKDIDLGAPVAIAAFKPSAGAGGIMQMIEKLIYDAKDLEKAAISSEAEAQASYEAEVTDTNDSILALQKSIVTKTKETGEAKKDKATAEQDLIDTVDELEGLGKYNKDLHKECDYYTKNFVTRREARAAEIEALESAKHILSGASS